MTEAQKRANLKYRKKKTTKEKNASKQKENFGNIAATVTKEEKNYISALFKAHGLKPSEVIRGAAAALRDGQTIRTESAPLQVPTEYTAQPLPTSTTDTDTPTE